MEAEKIQHLLFKYNAGEAGPGEIKEIENLIEQGTIQLEDIEGFGKMSDQIVAIETPVPSRSLDEKFHQMMKQERGIDEKTNLEKLFHFHRFCASACLCIPDFIVRPGSWLHLTLA